MGKIELAEDEWDNLMSLKRDAPYKLMKEKAEALLLLHKDVDIDIVASVVDKKPSTIKTWVRAWHSWRQASIRTGHAENINASKLTADQRADVLDRLSKPPSDETIPGQFWTVPKLAHWIYDHFEILYASDTSYHLLLHMAGLSFHKPAPFDQRRADEQAIAERMAQIRKAIADDLADPDTIVVAADEVRLEHEAIIRRAWIPRGAKPHIEVDRKRQAQSYIGFLDQNTGKAWLHPMAWQNGETVLAAVTKFAGSNPGKKITIVWDNASWHRAKVLREKLGPGEILEHLTLINMPPYAPDHNPIEKVWGEAKNSISNAQRATFDQTCHAFESFITGNEFPYRL